MSLRALSFAAKVGEAQVYRVVRGAAWPSDEWLGKVAKALGVEVSALLDVAHPRIDVPLIVGTLVGTMQTPSKAKDVTYKFRMTAIDRARLEALADRLELPAATVIRELVKEAADARGIVVESPKKKSKGRSK